MAGRLHHVIVVFMSSMVVLFSCSELSLGMRSPSSRFDGMLSTTDCKPSGYLPGKSGHCNREHESDCCEPGHEYPQYQCSPPITGDTKATMTINSFARGGDGGGPSECDNQYHNDDELVVALSTGWYNHGSRCLQLIRIDGNGKSVLAKVVDECDSVNGCDTDHDFQPPCDNNIVDASPAVWKALGLNGDEVGMYDINWSEA